MAATANLLPFSAPPTAAPDLSDYARFVACSVPRESGAARAYRGFIRPFSDDATARRVLRAIENGIPLQVSGGRLDVELPYTRNHGLDAYLVNMALPFTVLVLESDDTPHPRAYLTEPRMHQRLNWPTHLRTDKSISIDGNPHPALCVYSGALFKYTSERSRLEQFLDQTATYLAKYLIWLRTRQLFRPCGDGTRQFEYRRGPHEAVAGIELLHSPNVYWDGYWPGPSAPSSPAQHLATIKPGDECWCWTGRPYGECCRPRDLANSKHRARRLTNSPLSVNVS